MLPTLTADKLLARDQRLAFDCVRGFLALMLVVLHMGQHHIGVLPEAWMHQRLISVGMFFTLSGFLVTRSVLQKPVFDRLSFAKARVKRIYPAYLICILFALGISDARDLLEKPIGWTAAISSLISHCLMHGSMASPPVFSHHSGRSRMSGVSMPSSSAWQVCCAPRAGGCRC
jgi:hypothetical protein